MQSYYPVALLLLASITVADLGFEHMTLHHYARDSQHLSYETFGHRVKRQQQGNEQEFYVTQCGHNNTEAPTGPSINVLGRQLTNSDATEKAAALIHLMVRFMPRPIFLNLARDSSVGLFPTSQLPTNLFDEFIDNMPQVCQANCRKDVATAEGLVDCSPWCTDANYPYNTNYPLAYLWAYGNSSRTFVVENNVVCRGYNPGNMGQYQENLLIREYGLTVMTRGVSPSTLRQIDEAYAEAALNGTWQGIVNVYQYFMVATAVWFDGVTGNTNMGKMRCLNAPAPVDEIPCENQYEQRQRIRVLDPKLYDVLNYVYNNNRRYVNGDLSVCTW